VALVLIRRFIWSVFRNCLSRNCRSIHQLGNLAQIEARLAALVLARELRRKGQWIELGEGSFRLNKSFEAADKTARQIVILVFSN